jgi:hypothetical protein
MSHKHATTLGLALAMLGIVSTLGFVPVALADGNDTPMSKGVVATVTTIDADTAMATLKTEAGEVFERPEGWQWHVGHKVICDRIGDAPRPRFQHCRPWESAQVHERMTQMGPAPRR